MKKTKQEQILEMLEKLVYECQIRDSSRFKEVKELIKKMKNEKD